MNTTSGDEELEGREERTLGEVLEREGPMPARRVAQVAAQVLEALAAAHGRGEVHGDLTPAAIVLGACEGAPDAVRVIGFGEGRALGVETAGVAAGVVGAPGYAAPECLRGAPPAPRSDLYALGLVMAEALTGEAVVRGADAAATCAIHLDDEPLPIPPEVSSSPLGEVIRRAVEKDPEWRFGDAGEMLAVLERIPFAPDDDAWKTPAPARDGEAEQHAPEPAASQGGEAPAQKVGGRYAPFVKLALVVGAVLLVLLVTTEIGRFALRPDPVPPAPPAPPTKAAPPAPVVPDPPEVHGLRGATGDQVRTAILAAGWEIVDDSAYEMPGIQARTFRVRRGGDDEATVYWNEHRNRGVAQRMVHNMREAPTTVTAREGGTLVYIFHPYHRAEAQELLASILARVGDGAVRPDAGSDAGDRATQPGPEKASSARHP
jgi:hypothetical protein